MDVGGWLRSLGLGQYEAAFRENEIDDEVLPNLTAEDLRELGVAILGHRRKMLAAIVELCRSSAPPAPAECPPPVVSSEKTAERRQLTVMFCDLVGSTALSARLDPEDMREIIGAYHRCCAEQITKVGGFVAKYMGDGVLAYFGYPQAHEDDAERAVRSALSLVEAVLALPRGHDAVLQVRVGIATGVVVVGDLIGAGEAQERGVVGETPNLAARLQALAEPGQVVISQSTRRLTGGLFEYRDLGRVTLKGLAEPVQAWQALGASEVQSRFEAQHETSLTPLVGREEELELLLRRWRHAARGEGRVVLLSGEPGIGKSRLTASLQEHVQSEPHNRILCFCSPHHQDSTLYPVMRQLERDAGFARGDTPGAKLDKLAALITPAAGEGEISLVAELLSVPGGDRYPPLDLNPQRKKERTLTALLRRLEDVARQRPVLMIFEDLHWIDPTSRELLDLIVERIKRLSVLLLVTYRPEFLQSWSGGPHVAMLTLNRLNERDGAALIEGLAGNSTLGPEIVAEIVERTDGVPLFVEELTKAVLESAPRDKRVSAVLAANPLPSLAIPATLHASLIARLDRLGPAAKEIAQVGAVLGREFDYDLIEPVAQRRGIELQALLRQLTDAGLLFCRGAPPHASYLFKHALVQDAAYGTLLRGRRQELHGRVADALLAASGQDATSAPEIVAHHLENAGRPAEAIVFWREAGEQAVRRAANREAVGHLRRALSLVAALPETAERWRTELAILSQLSPALMSVHGWSAPEVGEAVERAAEIGRRLESSADLAPAIANLWIFNAARARFDLAEDIVGDLFRIAHELDDPEVMLQAHHCAWATNFPMGLFAEVSKHIDAGAALYEEERHAHHRRVYLGHDPGVCMFSFGAILQSVLGYPERGMRLASDGLTLARRLQHAPTLANALWRACEASALRDDAASVSTMARELLCLADAHGLPLPRAEAMILQGWALSRSGQTAEGIARLAEGLQLFGQIGARFQLAAYLGLMGESLLAARRYSDGLEQVGRALDVAAETGEQWYVSRLHRTRAELRLHAHGPDDEGVEVSLRQAIAMARQQGAKGWELGPSTSLARLWRDRGKRAEARDLLAPIYGWFTEGFDTTDLKEAKALLDTLASA